MANKVVFSLTYKCKVCNKQVTYKPQPDRFGLIPAPDRYCTHSDFPDCKMEYSKPKGRQPTLMSCTIGI